MYRLWIGLGALAGLTAVGMAAVAAHALSGATPGQLRAVDSAVQMQGWHALALVACGIWAERRGGIVHAAAVVFVAGLLAFCGAVYASALVGIATGVLAPTGGILLMLGWLLLGLAAIQR